jgi:putative hemolysin
MEIMNAVSIEILLIVFLVALNGIFALSEMAVVAARKTRLKQMAATGDARARAALQLSENPNRFLSTVQIGITLVGILAGAFGGATIAEQIAARLQTFGMLAVYAEAFALVAVVAAITFLSLVFGELVPKRIALNNAERIAAIVARPMNLLARCAAPFVRLLTVSTEIVLKLLRVKKSIEPTISAEEFKVLLAEGTVAGVFSETEQEMVESVFRLGKRRVAALMTPRVDVVWLDAADSDTEIYRKITESGYSRFPVCRERDENCLGIVKAKDYLAGKMSDNSARLESFLKQPLFLPETITALDALEAFKNSPTHLALIVDEHGAIEGLVTTNNILEAITGEVAATAGQNDKPEAVKRADNSWLVDGALPVDEFKELFNLEKLDGEQSANFQTVAGFVLCRLGQIPHVAESFEWNNLRFEIVDMDGRRIDKLLIERLREEL